VAVLRPHLAINVADVDRSIPFSEALFGVGPEVRLVTAGLATFDEMDTTCCYARQDKIWVHDPDGTPWEVFTTHEDVEVAQSRCCA
jgi:hypothetical protein